VKNLDFKKLIEYVEENKKGYLEKELAKKFYSICSAHQITDEECQLCKIGFWVDAEENQSKD
jgi:hypothetical protein